MAIALVPPLASVGIGLKMQDLVFAGKAGAIASINILAVIVSGFVTFKLLGLKPSTYYKQKEAERMKYIVPAAFIVLLLFAAPVIYSSFQGYQEYLEEQDIRHEASDFFGDSLLEITFQDSTAKVIVAGDFNETEFNEQVEDGIEIQVVELRKAG